MMYVPGFNQVYSIDSTTSTNTASNSSCTPLNCIATCTPNCAVDESCILRTMTSCGICPASLCMSRAILGLPPLPNNSNSSTENNSNNSGLIGGIVGGLIGLGILVAIGICFYIKRGRKKRQLPFTFTENGMGILSQEKFKPQQQQQATIVQQNRSAVSTEPSRFISLAELNTPTSPTTTSSKVVSAIQKQNKSLSFIQSNMNSNIATLSTNNNDTVNNNTSPPQTPKHISMSGPPVVPPEFEERIAIQNKRISQILHNNPRLSQSSYMQQAQPVYFDSNRASGISYTTDDDSEFDEDDKSVVATRTTVQQRTPPAQAVQVSRTKAQIMRVNSVRSTTGLGRSESVRTILTATTPPATDSTTGNSSIADSFPSTPNTHCFATTNENPFLDATIPK